MARTTVNTRVISDAINRPPAPANLRVTSQKARKPASAALCVGDQSPSLHGTSESSK